MSQATQLEYYYQSLGYRKLWLRFRELTAQHPAAYRHAMLYYTLYKRSVELAGI